MVITVCGGKGLRVSWIRLDDGFPRHRKVQELGRDIVAKWLHIVALCYCGEHLTDGLVDEIALRTIINTADVPPTAAHRAIHRLVETGLWITHEGRSGWLIRDYLEYNPTASSVREKREQAKARMASLREKSRDVRANGERTIREVRVPPSPTPTPISAFRGSSVG